MGSIYKWIPNKDMIYQTAGINNTKLTVHPGPKSKFEIVEEGLLNLLILILRPEYPLLYSL